MRLRLLHPTGLWAMPNYSRAFVAGGCWFFTVNLFDRRSRLLTERIDSLRAAVGEARERHPFQIDTMVVLPDHLHAVWTLPDDDHDFPKRWRLIKTLFSKSVPKGEWLTETRRARGERGIWQRRYWEHLIRDERDWRHHVEYCWFNPVKHGLVASVEDWPFTSFHRDTRDYSAPASYAEFEAALAERARADRAAYGERQA